MPFLIHPANIQRTFDCLMLKTRIILTAVAAIVVWLIFLLPKVVVENESQLKEATDNSAAPTGHSEIPAAITETIRKVKPQFQPGASNQKNAIFADSLRSLYFRAGLFYSAAWYAEQAAAFFNSKQSFLNAGNAYYEAFTFAMDSKKQEQLAAKAREWFGKVITSDPKNAEVRSKIAMTYLSSSPMQGISLLREVLADDPQNEFALFNMGMLSVQSGQFDRAIDYLTRLTAVNENHIQGNLLLGVAYMNKGDKNNARLQFEKVKQLDKDPAVQATADSYLKDLK
jgi:outer membrane protein